METPTIFKSTYGTSTIADSGAFGAPAANPNWNQGIAAGARAQEAVGAARLTAPFARQEYQQRAIQPQPKVTPMPTTRIVRVFIFDGNDNLPLDKRVIYRGEEKLTDLTDQELFFEVPITEILAKHNEVRKATVDKKQAEKFGRDIFIDSARIRDLKMVVVDIAAF